jgi:hypothetical protein
MLFSAAIQTRCSEAKEDLEYYDMEFWVSDCRQLISCGVIVYFRCDASKSVRLSLL